MPILRTLQVTCPECNCILVVNKEDGSVVEVRKPLVEESSGDRFTDAMNAAHQHSKKMKDIFATRLTEHAQKEKERDSLFHESLKKAQEEGLDDSRELRDIDLD